MPRPSGSKPFEVLVVPLSTANRPDVTQRASAMVFLHDPETLVTPLPNLLAGLYRLTPAEGRLAADLLAHLTLEENAERRSLSRETLRSQLKELFRKTGTSRQSELVGRRRGLREAYGSEGSAKLPGDNQVGSHGPLHPASPGNRTRAVMQPGRGFPREQHHPFEGRATVPIHANLGSGSTVVPDSMPAMTTHALREEERP
ncbi:MAG: helix-turn-helix transcriptional regulator [Reyranella sp.]|uniref:helix-turn-helix transcriptional regulator n=1 Tax=Reyranella sp. TaxID=1929291 RepID=UPI003D0E6634